MKSILISLFLFLTGISQIQKRSFEFYSSDEGLSQALVTSVVEDHYGFIWLGTKDGINRFDGYHFKYFYPEKNNKNSLNSSFINDLDVDFLGDIWVSTTLGFNKINPLNFHVTRYDTTHILSAFNNEEILKSFISTNQNLWFISKRKVWKYDGSVLEEISFNQNNKSYPMDIVFEDDDKTIWILFNNGQLFSSNGNKKIKFNNYEYEIEAYFKEGIVKIFSFKDQFMISTKDYLYIFNLGIMLHKLKISLPTYLVNDSYTNTYFIGGYENLYTFKEDEKKLKTIFGDNEFIGFESYHKDYLDNIWFGTRGFGVLKYDAIKYQFKLHELNIPDVSHIYKIYEYNKELWLESHNQVVRYDQYNNIKIAYRFPKYNTYYEVENKINLTATTINDFLGVKNRLLMSSDLGLHEFDFKKNKIKNINRLVINKFLKINDNTVWVSTKNGIKLFNEKKNNFSDIPELNKFNNIAINYFTYSNNNLWASNLDTLYHFNFKRNKINKYFNNASASSLSKGNILCIFIDSKETLWIGTAGGGLNKFIPETNSFKTFTTEFGLPNNVIYGILEDTFNKFWISTNKGIFRFDPITETFKIFIKEDGLQSNEFNTDSFYKDANGEMFFGGVKGLNSFIPEELEYSRRKPNLYITSFSLDNKSEKILSDKLIFDKQVFNLDYDENFISIEFTLVSYADPNKNFYRYRLKGFDKNWSKESNRSFVSYTNIPPGNYTFELESKTREMQNYDSKMQIYINISKPIWGKLYIQVIFFLSLIFILYLFVKYRYKKVDELNKFLESEIDKRTKEVNLNYIKLSKLDNIVRHLNSEIELDQLILRLLEETEVRKKLISAILFKNISEGETYKVISVQGKSDHEGEEFISHEVLKKKYIDDMIPYTNSILIDNRYSVNVLVFVVKMSEKNTGYLVLQSYEDQVLVEKDLTIFKDLEEHLNLALIKMTMVDELKYLNDRKDEFLGIASHDLRNPLQSISGYSDVLKLSVAKYKDSKLISYIDKISSIVTYMANIIEDLISISAIETGKIKLDKKLHSMTELIEESVEYFQISAKKKSITLEYFNIDVKEDFMFDIHRFKEVIDNLISNSIKYTYQGGSVKIFSQMDEDRVKIMIEDTGVGFNEDDKRIIFKEFKRLSAKPTGNEESTGFGLAIVKKIIDKHGGTIKLDEKKTKGSKFIIHLPFKH